MSRPAPRQLPVSAEYYPPDAGDEDMPPDPTEAWVDHGRNRGRVDVAKGRSLKPVAEDQLKLVLYTPPCTMEDLAKKLQVSVVMGSTARVSQAGFIAR